MPPLTEIGQTRLSPGKRFAMGSLRTYLAVSSVLVVVKVVQLSLTAR